MAHLMFAALLLSAPGNQAAPSEAPAPANARPADELRRATNEYSYGNYQLAIEQLRSLLYPMRLVSDEQVIEARKYLALCYYLSGKPEAMRDEFEKLLYLDPDHQLDAFSIPPSIIDTFEQVRLARKTELDAIRQRRADASMQQQATAGTTRVVEHVTHERSELGTLLPFGVGQFQNGATGWGVAFAVLEAVVLAVNVGSYLYLEFGVGDEYPPEESRKVRALTIVQYAGLGLFGITWGLGVLHARLNFVPSVASPPVVRDEPTLGAGLSPGALLEVRF